VGNVEKLTKAGLITSAAALKPADHDLIEKLTEQEVAALISIKSKLTADFTDRHLSATATGVRPAVGIVF